MSVTETTVGEMSHSSSTPSQPLKPLNLIVLKKLSVSSLSENNLVPSTPSSLRHGHLDLTNDTSPSSTNDNLNIDNITKLNTNSTITAVKTNTVKNNHDAYEIDPLHIPNDTPEKALKSRPYSFKFDRRHTTNDFQSYTLGKKYTNDANTTSPLHPINSLRNITKRTSLDYARKVSSNESANSEMQRMRNSIILRGIRKKRRDFYDDDRVLFGNKISEGHENFVMAYNMLTGIRVAVSRCSGLMKKLNDEDFRSYKKLTFNMDGSEMTPSSKYDFKFKDYCPEVFRDLRQKFGLDPADYLISITGKYILSELGSPGKSGSFFYYSRDFRFIIKTIRHSEHKQLRRILKLYYNHIKANPNTLVSQIYGLHRVKMPLTDGVKRKVHFIVMNNLFPPHRDIHLKFDLKGSTWGRYTQSSTVTDKAGSEKPLKDLNWLEMNQEIKFGSYKRKLFFDQLDRDVKFLESINVMDYSLLLGIHDVKNKSQMPNSGYKNLSIFDPKSNDKFDLITTNLRDIKENDLPNDVYPGRSKFIFYGHDGGIRSTNEANEPSTEIYYLGIIDFLTNYSLKKRLETFWRSLSHNRSTISALPAKEYGERFLKFIKKGTTKEKID